MTDKTDLIHEYLAVRDMTAAHLEELCRLAVRRDPPEGPALISPKRRARCMAAILGNTIGLMLEKQDEWWQDYEEALRDYSGDAALGFPLGIRATIKGGFAKVRFSWSRTHALETEFAIPRDQTPDMFDDPGSAVDQAAQALIDAVPEGTSMTLSIPRTGQSATIDKTNQPTGTEE